MTLSTSALVRLALDDGLREVVDSARRITSHVARRREERRLAGVLRSADFDDLEARLAKVTAGGDADERPFHKAEAWRTRLLDDPAASGAFVAEHPTIAPTRLAGLIEAATRERATGRPPGAARALFRFVLDALSAPAADPDDAAAGDDEADVDATDDD